METFFNNTEVTKDRLSDKKMLRLIPTSSFFWVFESLLLYCNRLHYADLPAHHWVLVGAGVSIADCLLVHVERLPLPARPGGRLLPALAQCTTGRQGKHKTVSVPDLLLEYIPLSLALQVACCLLWRNARWGAKMQNSLRFRFPFGALFSFSGSASRLLSILA